MLMAAYLGTLLLVLPGIYVGLRLFWADEYALVHGSGAISALQSSWRLTQGNAGEILKFQFLAGLAAYGVLGVAALLMFALGVGSEAISTAVVAPLEATLTIFLCYVGYGLVHAPEVIHFYGMRAEQSRSLVDSTKTLNIT